MPTFEHSGATLYYEEVGTGTALVFLHGASWDLRQWARQVECFSKGYHVITLDARGHGRSTLPAGEVSPDIFWQDVVALLDHLHIDKAILCGLSMGGHTALQVAGRTSGRVLAVIAIGAICTNSFNWYERLAVPLNRASLRLMSMKQIGWCVSVGMGNFAPETRPYIREVVGSMSHDAFTRTWKAITGMESRADLPNISCPVLLLVGDHDSMTGRQQQYMREHIKNAQLVIIENAHHGTNLDNPEQVECEIDRFLKLL